MKSKGTIFRRDYASGWVGPANEQTPPVTPLTYVATGSQELIESYGHPFRPRGGFQGDKGGAFWVVRRELSERNAGPFHNRSTTDDNNIFASNYIGKYYAHAATVSNFTFPGSSTPSDSYLEAMGTLAISQVIPTNPLAGLMVALAELRSEGLPHLVGNSLYHRTARAKAAGDEYLNVEFGWKPLVNDVRSLAHSYLARSELTRKYESESGKLLRREYQLPDQNDVETSSLGNEYPEPVGEYTMWWSPGAKTVSKRTRTEIWFSGAFTYYLAPQGSNKRAEQIANKLYGTRLTPETLWNLTPWTWLADWVTNTGAVIHNVSAFANDGLVMPYAYVMARRTAEHAYTLDGASMRRYPSGSFSCNQTFRTITKRRIKATPYGFGLNPATFSDRQWAILAALGLSKGTGHLP